MTVYILVGIESESISLVEPFDSFEKIKGYCSKHFSLCEDDWHENKCAKNDESTYDYRGDTDPINNGPNQPMTRYNEFWVYVREIK